MIIASYLRKEVFQTLLAVTFILLLIFLSNQFVRYLSYAASGKIAANIVLELMGFEIPYLLAVLLPLGLYLGIIIAYGRLYADNELRVMRVSGLSITQLFFITSSLILLMTIVVTVLVLWVNPVLASKKDQLISNSMVNNILDTLMPGRFQVMSDNKRVVYVERISRKRKEADNLFFAEQKESTHADEMPSWVVLSAAKGYQMKDPETQDQFIVAENGYRYEGRPGENNYKIFQFKKYAVRLLGLGVDSRRKAEEIVPTLTLWQEYEKPKNAAELQWRLSMPLSAFLLAMLAIPLSYTRPRQGRYTRLFPAILIYVVYMNLLFVSRDWIEQKTISIVWGMWWVHLLMLGLLLLFFLWQSRIGFFKRFNSL